MRIHVERARLANPLSFGSDLNLSITSITILTTLPPTRVTDQVVGHEDVGDAA